MARNGVTKLYTATPGGSTQGTDLRTWMAANLTEVTVGAMYTFSSGASERNYWTLTFASGAEILVCCPNGTWMYSNNLYIDLDTREGDWLQPLVLVYSPEGGFEAALVAALDPDTTAFKEHITDTLGFREPSKGISILYWRSGSGANHQLHITEDDDGSTIIFTFSRASAINSNYMSCYIASDDMFTEYPSGTPLLWTFGLVYVGANNVAGPNKTIHTFCAYGWESESNIRAVCEPSLNTLPFANNTGPAFDQIASGRYPFVLPLNEDWAAELWAFSTDRPNIIYRCNANLIRLTGQNNPRFNQSQGDSTNYKFIKHIQRFLTPWDHAQTPPT